MAQRVLEEADQIKVLSAQGKAQLVRPLQLGDIETVEPYILLDLVQLLSLRAPKMPAEIRSRRLTLPPSWTISAHC